jgi:hypothetical protein
MHGRGIAAQTRTTRGNPLQSPRQSRFLLQYHGQKPWLKWAALSSYFGAHGSSSNMWHRSALLRRLAEHRWPVSRSHERSKLLDAI